MRQDRWDRINQYAQTTLDIIRGPNWKLQPLEADMTIAPQANSLAETIKRLSEDSKNKLANAQTRLAGSFEKINAAAGHVEGVAATVEKSADEVLAAIGQLTNMGPTE